LILGGEYLENLTYKANSDVSYALDIVGGYESAKVTLPLTEADIGGWIERGLGRVIDIYDDTTFKCFQGYVNEIELRMGRLALRKGPLLGSSGICTRVWSVYSPMDTTVNPPTYGTRTLTAISEDTDAQAKYGIIERVLSAGSTTTAIAAQMQEVYLDEHKRPYKSHDIGDSATPQVVLTIWGFYQWLEAAIYEYVAASGTVTITTKLQDILTQSGAINAWSISSDYTKMDVNAVLVPAYDRDDMTCLSVLKAVASLGGPAYEQWSFGLYDNRVPVFKAIPTAAEYQIKAISGGLEVRDTQGHIIPHAYVQPGKWAIFSDILPGKTVNTNLRDEDRAILIKRVEFSPPNDLKLNGADANTLPQILAQYGLGGV
jgi:hypothetical protein